MDIADLRGLLYGLYAILGLHTAQEDESYVSLGDGIETAPADRQQILATQPGTYGGET